jgi:hypothetical protein
MSGFFQNLLKDTARGFFGNDYVRDYTHAAKTFRSNAYQYSPKFKFLFHVYFEINPAAYSKGLSQGANFGLAVKTIDLPKYNIETATLNQYNRKRLVQTKIKYQPITVVFHDDNGNLVNDMWYNYYTYYFQDANKPVLNGQGRQTTNGINAGANYNRRNLYDADLSGDEDWGYIGETDKQSGTTSQASQGISKIPFFKNIQIFGLSRHNFIQYTLINPVITAFNHDTYDYAQGNGTMSNTMTIDYETVKYAEGAIDGRAPSNIVTGFGLESNYDRTPSPINRPGANATILGQGGLVDAAGGFINDLANGNILGAVRTAGTAYNTFKNKNLKQIATQDLNSMLYNVTQQQLPGAVRSNTYYPGYGTTPNNTAGMPGSGLTNPPRITPTGTGLNTAPGNAGGQTVSGSAGLVSGLPGP